ncbi:Uncharacterised protein [Burkholderia pseudomallei]|nr:Uncharacterised protein [Burkholderia pseudomallei]CAJ3113043.1 Uncharacterised protein [Burkholderia pseudomallei]CAJ3123216.1 Uncharacterised protein [Burkholderia pseudomallei]CAJ3195708.1 Uncharacterised protein [Burkholderia pseudomallei]CAJ3757135.1 Uncharacterised protein [Burkholderia pseudomallei]
MATTRHRSNAERHKTSRLSRPEARQAFIRGWKEHLLAATRRPPPGEPYRRRLRSSAATARQSIGSLPHRGVGKQTTHNARSMRDRCEGLRRWLDYHGMSSPIFNSLGKPSERRDEGRPNIPAARHGATRQATTEKSAYWPRWPLRYNPSPSRTPRHTPLLGMPVLRRNAVSWFIKKPKPIKVARIAARKIRICCVNITSCPHINQSKNSDNRSTTQIACHSTQSNGK